MIFFRFVVSRAACYLLAVASAMAMLYTTVELLEKFSRHHEVVGWAIMRYAGLVFVPSLVFLFPLSMMLGTLLFLRIWVLEGKDASMAIYGISTWRFIWAIAFTSLGLAAALFILQETIGFRLYRKMIASKSLLFKADTSNNLWKRLGATGFIWSPEAHRSFILHVGSNPALICCDETLQGKKISLGSLCRIDEVKLLPEGSTDDLTTSFYEISLRKTLEILPGSYGWQMLADMACFFLSILFIPFFVSMLFFLFLHREMMRWIMPLFCYLFIEILGILRTYVTPLQGVALQIGFFAVISLILSFYLARRVV